MPFRFHLPYVPIAETVRWLDSDIEFYLKQIQSREGIEEGRQYFFDGAKSSTIGQCRISAAFYISLSA